MSHPGEPADDIPRCTAKSSQTGQRCRNRPVRGATVCSTHGGSAPQVKAAAERRRTEQQAAALAAKLWDANAAPVTDGVSAVQQWLGSMRDLVNTLGEQMDAGEELDQVRLQAFVALSRDYGSRLVDFERLGLENRVVSVMETQGEQVYELVAAIGRATLAGLVQLLADQPAALEALEAGYERVHEEAARVELGALHELEVGVTVP